MMINSRFIQAEQEPGRSCEVSSDIFQLDPPKDLKFQISDLRFQIDISLNYCEKTVARNSAASTRDRRLRNEAAVPVRRTHDPGAKLQRKELRPRKPPRRSPISTPPPLPL